MLRAYPHLLSWYMPCACSNHFNSSNFLSHLCWPLFPCCHFTELENHPSHCVTQRSGYDICIVASSQHSQRYQLSTTFNILCVRVRDYSLKSLNFPIRWCFNRCIRVFPQHHAIFRQACLMLILLSPLLLSPFSIFQREYDAAFISTTFSYFIVHYFYHFSHFCIVSIRAASRGSWWLNFQRQEQ